MMNKGNVLSVADAIEKHSIPDLGFNMGAYLTGSDEAPDLSGHNCDTVSCIAGWAVAVSNEGAPLPTTMDIGGAAQRFLGLSTPERMALFVPTGWLNDSIQPGRAIAVLRHLAETGEVDWSVA